MLAQILKSHTKAVATLEKVSSFQKSGKAMGKDFKDDPYLA